MVPFDPTVSTSKSFRILTEHDTNSLDPPVRAIMPMTQGNIVVEDNRGNEITLVNVPAFTLLPIAPKKLKTATAVQVLGLE